MPAFAGEDAQASAQRLSPDIIRVAQANPTPAATGTELEEVIVTAERRTVDIQSVPASVTVRTGEELAAQGRYTTRQILEDIPGLVAIDNGSLNIGTGDVQGNSVTIRGITPGPSAGGGPTHLSAAPGAAIYVDGVIEGVGSGYDIDRVEVLRGPQGTLYGRSATSGVVAFHTRNPTFDAVTGNAGAEFGNYALRHYTGAVNIPLTNGLAVRVSGDYHDQGDAYYGDASRGLSTRTNGRAKLLWQPNDDFSLLMGVAYEKRDDFSGGNSTTARPPTLVLTTVLAPVFPSYKESRQYWAEANLNVGPATVTYLPAFRTWEQNDHIFGTTNFLSSGAGRQALVATPRDHFNTHELRVASRDSIVQWQTGVFYYRNTVDNTNHNFLLNSSGAEISFLSDSRDTKSTLSQGIFAETTFPLGGSLRMTLGARYDDTEVVVSEYIANNPYGQCGTVNQRNVVLPAGAVCTGPGQASVPIPAGTFIPDIPANFHNFNYKARLEWDLTPKNLLYGMVSTGFRPGDAGINATTRAVTILDAEKLTSIEVGSKNRFLDDSLQVNIGVYYYNYHGFQTTYVPDTSNPLDPGGSNTAIRLTVPAHNLGAELELLYRLTARDRFGLNGNYVESRWYDKPAAFDQAQPETKRAMTPYTFTANYEHVFPLPGGSTLSARIDGRYEAAHLGSNLHVDWLRLGYGQYVELSSRTIGNFSAAWASDGGRYSISAYVRNFTNKQYIAYTVGGDQTSLGVSWTDPRTYGAEAFMRF
jgi:outer membrane receptor protein involved in Fe transport